jgi:hypothetical protein
VGGWVDGLKDSYTVCLVRPSGIVPPQWGPKLQDLALGGGDNGTVTDRLDSYIDFNVTRVCAIR